MTITVLGSDVVYPATISSGARSSVQYRVDGESASQTMRKAAQNEHHLKARVNKNRARSIAAAQRPERQPSICAVCGSETDGKREKFCSNECAQKYHNARYRYTHTAQIAADGRERRARTAAEQAGVDVMEVKTASVAKRILIESRKLLREFRRSRQADSM